MKRVFFVMAFIVTLVSLNAAYVFPGWHIKDAWAYCLANPGDGDQNFLALPGTMLGITEETKNKMLYEVFTKNYYMTPNQTMLLVKNYLNYLATADISNDVAYAQISTLNKIYTNKLVDNPTAWEPVVAHIRTVLEAYQK